MMRIALPCAAAAFAFVAAMPAAAADSASEIHGSADAFAMPGLALAWAILRAPKEQDTAIVLRIEPDPSAYAWIEIIGKDPFSQREDRLQAATAVGGPFDLKVGRARFADFPRTEIRLWRAGPAPDGGPPALVVYYLGVPDTTPEIAQPLDLDRSLSARIARARDPARKSP
jgi:hypothetical protein